MFCKNCGEKLESQNQKFCASCGSEISNTPAAPQTPQAPQLKAEQYQAPKAVRSVPVYESKPIRVGGPGPHSKKCFAFSIVSLGLAGAGFIFGGTNFFGSLNPYSPYPLVFSGIFGLIIGTILNVTGLIFGILSRTNSSKAGKHEPINTLEKSGSVFAVFGIVLNSIPLAGAAVSLVIMLINLILIPVPLPPP